MTVGATLKIYVPEGEGAQLTRYEQMRTAIAECVRVDEAKDIRDKSAALEAYYRQARDLEAEREVAAIRLRAERRVGELLRELARATPQEVAQAGGLAKAATSTDETKQTPPSPYAAALADNGMSRQAAHKFQALADIPAEKFEAALAGPEKPSTAGVLRDYREARDQVMAPKPKVSQQAIFLWGHLCDFEREDLLGADLSETLRTMTEQMRADVARLIPQVRTFLDRLEEAVHEPA